MNNLPVTKTDLNKAVAKLATKEELKTAVAKLDHKIDIVETSLRITFKFEIDKAVISLDDKNKKYHDDLMTKFDDFLGEIIDGRQERTIVSHRLSDHEERICVLEQTAGIAAA
mgnify:CR=1 FL=1